MTLLGMKHRVQAISSKLRAYRDAAVLLAAVVGAGLSDAPSNDANTRLGLAFTLLTQVNPTGQSAMCKAFPCSTASSSTS